MTHAHTQMTLPGFEEYSKFTSDSAFYPNSHTGDFFEHNYLILGLGGEAGEAVDVWKKICRSMDISAFNLENPRTTQAWQEHGISLAYELGDLMWYVSHMLRVLDITLEELLIMNAYKLYMRHKTQGPLEGWEWPYEHIMTQSEASVIVERIEERLLVIPIHRINKEIS